MSKRLRLTLAGLAASLAMLVAMASVQPVNADLLCQELAACEGLAGCASGGDPTGCHIVCTGGGSVTCDEKQN